MKPVFLAFAVLAVSCDGCGAGQRESERPPALADLREDSEVVPFEGWSVPGVTLYRVSWHVPDHSSSRIVGVDDATGERIEGRALMRRLGTAPPEELARRTFDVLLAQQGRVPLTPGGERARFASDEEWALVRDPHVEDGVLVFWGIQGEMRPEVVEHRLAMDSFELRTQSAQDVLLARGEVVAIGGPMCVPIARCGCWDGCVLAEPIRVPEGERGSYRLGDGTRLELREECVGSQCFRVCRADSPTAHCDDGALSPLDEECEESCPPSEAPYHCATLEGRRCARFDHLRRPGG